MAKIIHCPPDKEKIEHIVRQTCKKIAKKRGNEFRSYEVIEGLSEFVQIVAQMKAENLNQPSRNKRTA